MIIGDFISKMVKNKACLRTVKIQILNNQNLELNWPLEVIESRIF